MRTSDALRERAARARCLANVKNGSGRPTGSRVDLLELADGLYLLELADEFERQADLLERAGQKPKEPPTR